ncbi:uncharacterized protein LOC114540541 [Dendronephthya gigantea]|uniref:uncharacterized protein LOC114540541 n=1 Tax=Dendronephthya gigantea TaxID=151771 RepID=UPI00106927ED|nr:uncharacterized protein LOC114540541 [Dendronephthya gigantea]
MAESITPTAAKCVKYKKKQRFISSDFRAIRASRLSKLYVADRTSRVECYKVLNDINEQAAQLENDHVSSRECGFIIRHCFPGLRRIHSNHVYFYSGIRRIIASDTKPHDNDSIAIYGQASATIPKSFFLKRAELLDFVKLDDQPLYSFDNGIASTTVAKHFRDLTVAVQEFTVKPIHEAEKILDLPSHPCLPLLIGLCCEEQPYLSVTKFYGAKRIGLMLSISAAIAEGPTKRMNSPHWMSIICDIAKGLLHMHTNGFLHGDLKPSNIILYRKPDCDKYFQPVFLGLTKVTKFSIADIEKLLIFEDLIMFQHLVKNILNVVTLDDQTQEKFMNMISVATTYDEQWQMLENVIHFLETL